MPKTPAETAGLHELSLFTGAGGGLLGTRLLGWRTVGYVEWDPYCQAVLKQRIADGHLHAAPIFGDIRAFVRDGYARAYRGMVDVVSGGFPCQPFSVAGARRGADDERNMWPATAAVIGEVRPRYCFLENVPGLLSAGAGSDLAVVGRVGQRGLFDADDSVPLAGRYHRVRLAAPDRYVGQVLGDLARLGYDARWGVVGADDAGAPHRRKRLWIIARCRDRLVDAAVPQQQIGEGDASVF